MNKGLIERQTDVTGIETDVIECRINNKLLINYCMWTVNSNFDLKTAL